MVFEGWRCLYREPAGLDERATGAGTVGEPDTLYGAARRVCPRVAPGAGGVEDAIDAPLRPTASR